MLYIYSVKIRSLPEVHNTLRSSSYYGHIKALTQGMKALSISTVPTIAIKYPFYSPTVFHAGVADWIMVYCSKIPQILKHC